MADAAPPRYEDIIRNREVKVHGRAIFPQVVSSTASTALPQAVVPPVVQADVPESSTKVILNVIYAWTYFLLGTVVFSAFVIANGGSSGPYHDAYAYAKHIYLCVIGYMVLLAQSVLAFTPQGWARGLSPPQRLLLHGTLQVVGSSLALAGCFVKVNSEENYVPNHAYVGWIVMLLTIASLVGGIFNFKYYEEIKHTRYKNHHSYLFIAVLCTAFLCLSVAFHDVYYDRETANSALSIVFTVLAMIAVLYFAFLRVKK